MKPGALQIDLMIPTGSPIYAVRGGTVARVVNWPHNCWELGRCDQPCGIGLSIDGDDGARYIYCHGSRLNGAQVGQTVAVGELLMWSGSTGRSGAPHLHFELAIDQRQLCPQLLLLKLYEAGTGVGASDLPDRQCAF